MTDPIAPTSRGFPVNSRLGQALRSCTYLGYWSALKGGSPWSCDPVVWELVPHRVKHWMRHSLFERANDQAYEELMQERELQCVLPFTNADYSLPFATLMYLWSLLRKRKPRSILEFGSGISTVLFAAYARQQRCGTGENIAVVSIEDSERWTTATKLILEQLGLSGYANVINSPLVERRFGNDVCIAYDVSPNLLQRISNEVDFCFIDGPPGKEVGRLGSFRIARPHIGRGAAVLLDDAFRTHEQDCWATWRSQPNSKLSRGRLVLLPHGLRIGTWKGP